MGILSSLFSRLSKRSPVNPPAYPVLVFDARGRPSFDGRKLKLPRGRRRTLDMPGLDLREFRRGRIISNSEFFQATFSRLDEDLDEPLTDPYKQLSAVYSCVRAVAVPISMVPLSVFKWQGEEKVLDDESPLAEVLFRPNPISSRFQLIEGTVANLELNGEFFWYLERERPSDPPERIWLVDPNRMTPIPDPKTGIPIAWQYDPGDRSKRKPIWETWQIVHGKYWNPDSEIRGLAPWEAATMAGLQDWDAGRYNRGFIRNNCDPGGHLEADYGLTEKQERNLLRQFTNRTQGPGKAGLPEVFEEGIKWVQNQIPHRDMQWLKQREWNLQEIRMVMGVGKVQLGLTDGVNYATADIQERIFWTHTLIPITKLIEDAIYSVLGDETTEILFDLGQVEALRKDAADRADAAAKYHSIGVPFNQINSRLELGFEEYDGWDISYLPINVLPAGSPPPAPGGNGQARDAGGFPLPPEIAEPLQRFFKDVVEGKREPILIGDAVTVRTPDAGYPFADDPEGEKEYAEKFDIRVFRPNEESFERKVRRWFFEYRKENLRLYAEETGWESRGAGGTSTKAEGTGATPTIKANDDPLPPDFAFDLTLPPSDEWKEKIAKLTRAGYEQALLDGAKFAASDMGTPLQIEAIRADLAGWIDTRCTAQITRIEDTLRDQLKASMAEGAAAGETIGEIATRVKRIHKNAQNRAMTIAQTEVRKAGQYGAYQEAKETGVIEGNWWIPGGANIRDSHLAMQGQFRPLDEPFVTGEGNLLMYPHDPAGEAHEVINCKCVLRAKVKEF